MTLLLMLHSVQRLSAPGQLGVRNRLEHSKAGNLMTNVLLEGRGVGGDEGGERRVLVQPWSRIESDTKCVT